jgi:hypothetical protein
MDGFKVAFPNLVDPLSKKTSDEDDNYNCIAWAFGDHQKNWWPNNVGYHWPLNAISKTDMQAFEEWFAQDGWEESSDPLIEAGYEKVALYSLNGQPTHAARLLDSGLWTSKLGKHVDLSHDLNELSGPKYGQVHKIYRKHKAPLTGNSS